ncbi:MAG: redox-sensing transcriptional repressor Rex [Alkaliphilus sp.]|nr:redox-sensing transcriptional repressor Rex [Alkaliphilus sp.]
MKRSISIQTLQRLPIYLNFLKELSQNKRMNISAKCIADNLRLGEIQVRKDLAAVSSGGKPKVGYVTEDLIKDIEINLGHNNLHDAVLVGAGKLGKALLSYDGFKGYGLNIVAAFDVCGDVLGSNDSGKQILAIDKMKDLCERMKVRIGIITVPADSAQKVCDMLVESGILAIWNFAPTHLSAPENILIKSENMASSLALLSMHLIKNIDSKKGEMDNEE